MLDESNGIVGGFAIVPNYCLRDKRVKPTDKGIYAYICGNAPEFLCSEKAIASNLGICPDTVSKAIKRLGSPLSGFSVNGSFEEGVS